MPPTKGIDTDDEKSSTLDETELTAPEGTRDEEVRGPSALRPTGPAKGRGRFSPGAALGGGEEGPPTGGRGPSVLGGGRCWPLGEGEESAWAAGDVGENVGGVGMSSAADGEPGFPIGDPDLCGDLLPPPPS